MSPGPTYWPLISFKGTKIHYTGLQALLQGCALGTQAPGSSNDRQMLGSRNHGITSNTDQEDFYVSDSTGNKHVSLSLKILKVLFPCFSRFEISSQISLSKMVKFKYKLYLNNVPNLLEDLLRIKMLEIKMRAPF